MAAGKDDREYNRDDRERNRLSARARRYAKVSANVGGVAARAAGGRLRGSGGDRRANAVALKQALGGLKGPVMKVAQLLATIPEALPPEYAQELSQLQMNAPAMGWPFVKRRMRAELGPDWQQKFAEFGRSAAAAASLGQVHRARLADGAALACKLQYPDMRSAVEADLVQLKAIFALHRRIERTVDTREIEREIGTRLREELDYQREGRHMALYGAMLADAPDIHVPRWYRDLSTERLLCMEWLAGEPLMAFRDAPQEIRNRIAQNLFTAWWRPFVRFGVIHGDPHPGNYTIAPGGGLNLLDYGCVRIFRPDFVAGVVDLYRALRDDDRTLAAAAYAGWGFEELSDELVDALNIWARFIYRPMLDDRVRSVADGIAPGEYGRAEAEQVRQALKRLGPVRPPREFVFMDRAAIGLGGVFLHLAAELNWHALFESALADFNVARLARRQADALAAAGLALPE